MKIHELHQKALGIALNFRNCESQLIEILQQIEQQKAHLHLGYQSLFAYATECLKLSEANAYNLITVARKAKEIPELQSKIQSGEITVNKARRIASVIKTENKMEWLQKAKDFTQRELEREIAKKNPEKAVQERSRFIAKDRLSLQLGISEELFQKLKIIQDWVSDSKRKPASLEETLEWMTELCLKKKDPVKKAKVIQKKKERGTPGFNRNLRNRKLERTPIPAAIQHQVNIRDKRKCQFVLKNGKSCGSSRWLHFHHRLPVAEGGSHSVWNLTTLCSSHHRIVHEKPQIIGNHSIHRKTS